MLIIVMAASISSLDTLILLPLKCRPRDQELEHELIVQKQYGYSPA